MDKKALDAFAHEAAKQGKIMKKPYRERAQAC